jgi:hypothetical protein
VSKLLSCLDVSVFQKVFIDLREGESQIKTNRPVSGSNKNVVIDSRWAPDTKPD